ncbi:hypothetical protein NSP_22380 [Nodularia spumigena CCY9414]|nr:hypothetical protein NSP_22380 [Nodularia spumigena CCY9414]
MQLSFDDHQTLGFVFVLNCIALSVWLPIDNKLKLKFPLAMGIGNNQNGMADPSRLPM